MTIFQLLRKPLIGETLFAMTSFFYKWPLIRTTVAAVIVAHPGSAAGLLGVMLRGKV